MSVELAVLERAWERLPDHEHNPVRLDGAPREMMTEVLLILAGEAITFRSKAHSLPCAVREACQAYPEASIQSVRHVVVADDEQ